jgi:NAD+ synthase
VDFLSVSKRIEEFISSKVKDAGANGIVVGISGGLDSAVVATLAARAVGPDNVLGLIMPSPITKRSDVEDAKSLAHDLGIHKKVIPLKSILGAFKDVLDGDERAMGNLAARVRMCLMYYQANRLGYLVAGTGNKSEISIGYFTKHGDGGCDILPIGDLYKTEVRQLAGSLGVLKKFIDKTPTAGLWPGQTDEGEIGKTYEELDSILMGGHDDIEVRLMMESSEHKRKTPEVCKI